MSRSVHVSSLLITARPSILDEVCAALRKTEILEIAYVDPNGKIIVTLETDDESQIVQALTEIQLIQGVVNASMVYHQVDDSVDSAA